MAGRRITLRHATTRQALASIREQGLLMAHADPAARIRGIWLHTASKSAWAVVHTQRRHTTALEDVVIIEIRISRSKLRRFRSGLWYCQTDITATAIGQVWTGAEFGVSASE